MSIKALLLVLGAIALIVFGQKYGGDIDDSDSRLRPSRIRGSLETPSSPFLMRVSDGVIVSDEEVIACLKTFRRGHLFEISDGLSESSAADAWFETEAARIRKYGASGAVVRNCSLWRR